MGHLGLQDVKKWREIWRIRGGYLFGAFLTVKQGKFWDFSPKRAHKERLEPYIYIIEREIHSFLPSFKGNGVAMMQAHDQSRPWNDPRGSKSCNPPDLLQESLGPFGPEVSRECRSGCFWGPSSPGLRSVQKVSRECPRSVQETILTLRGHSRDTFGTLRGPGPKGARDTPMRDTPGILRAQRARETPVAGRGGLQSKRTSRRFFLRKFFEETEPVSASKGQGSPPRGPRRVFCLWWCASTLLQYRHIRNYYLSNSKTFQDGNGNGNF